MSYTPERIVETMEQFGGIEVGGFYQDPGAPKSALYGVVKVTKIRRWSDGLIDVELSQKVQGGKIKNYVCLEQLLGNDQTTGEPILKRVEPPQE